MKIDFNFFARIGLKVVFVMMVFVMKSICQNSCGVSITDFNSDTAKSAGEFYIDQKELKDNPKFKIFPFPNKKGLFITVGSQLLEPLSQNKIVLSLIIGKQGFKNGFGDLYGKKAYVLSTASSTFLLDKFETAEITTLYLEKKEPILITLECSVKETSKPK